MGLDIYTGTLTRYYARNWKGIVQQHAEENGMDFQLVRQHDSGEPLPDVSEIEAIAIEWQQNLADGLREHTGAEIKWPENNDDEYATDKPDWNGYGAVLLWAIYKDLGIDPPTLFDKNWASSDINILSKQDSSSTSFPSITKDCELWLPIDIDFNFQFIDIAGNDVSIGSSLRLFEELNALNIKSWNATGDEIRSWRKSTDPDSNALDELARFGFSILYALTEFSVTHKTPMVMDY